MQNDANVVHLTRVASEPSPNAGAGRLPVILVQVRDKAALQLKQALQALFDNADDTLFEMADRATSNLEQNAFFEAMRDLRLKRKSIERVYLQKVFEEFSALNQVQSGKSVPTLDTVSFDSLSLVQNEELEESVAVDAMVARVMSRDATALAHLSTRLNTLVGRKVDEKSNPLAPRPLTAAFLDACQGLGVEIKVKLIILKLFEKYVLAHCDQLYAEANQILVAAGVLPELKSALPRRQPAVRPEAVRDAGTLQAQAALLDGGQQEVFGALQELLAQVRDNPSFYRRETPENAAPISSNDLMRLLSHLQQHLPGPGAAEFDVRDGVDQLLQRVSHKSGRSRVVGQVDDDVINLVSMLFEFILDDRTLPDSLKALIGRMQIPMLKVALLDKTFFSRGSHPARRLLNEIASASLGWAEHNDARRDSLYQKIEQVVMRLLNDFVDDPAIFALPCRRTRSGDPGRQRERTDRPGARPSALAGLPELLRSDLLVCLARPGGGPGLSPAGTGAGARPPAGVARTGGARPAYPRLVAGACAGAELRPGRQLPRGYPRAAALAAGLGHLGGRAAGQGRTGRQRCRSGRTGCRRRRQPGCALAIAGARGRALVRRVRLLRAVPLSAATGNPPAIPR